MQRLSKMVEAEEQLRKDVIGKEKKMKRVEKENEELLKEMKAKKKFVLKM